ncbi:MAG TPA: DNA polymerase/3'-5' exonuclease PolX [Candidatus Aminicenantes bacterium]|nr:DNA polymerase/3'-5' exonuclease PolX [Candidatus Aminicenantes bacterium]
MKNKEIAAHLDRIADALEIKGEIGFKVIAYRKAARVLADMTDDIENLAAEGRLQQIPGIGGGIARKIDEYLKTGEMKKYREALTGIPEGLLELLEIQGLGGKTIHLMHQELGIRDLEDLKRAVADGSLAGLRGMGEKRVENIRKGIESRERVRERVTIYEASLIADELIAYLKKTRLVSRVSAAGSLRRMKKTVGDIDILATGKPGAEIIRRFTGFPGTLRVLAQGETKGSIVVRIEGAERQADLRIVAESEYGSALQYFTGSKAHNIKLRGMAKERGLKLSEYGVFRGDRKIAGREEEDVYEALDLPWMPPEMREDRGEIELAARNALPMILGAGDIRGDLHVHTRASDGSQEIPELVELARRLGYSYIAVCDHSQSVKYAGGLSPERLKRQMREIDAINQDLGDFRILKGTEVDILHDGTLDFPDEILRDLDFVVAAVHSGFKTNVTERMLRAMENPLVRVIAHPSGRLISGREGYDVDLDRVLKQATETGTALELNAYYDRLDLNEFYLKKAREAGIKISLGTDTHSAGGLQMMRFGVGIARRAWLEKSDVINSLSGEELAAKSRAAALSPSSRRRARPSRQGG